MADEKMEAALKKALREKLVAMGDDELILGHLNSEWCGHAPILEEDIAFANIAQDEMGHAQLWYQLAHELGAEEPDRLVFFRNAGAYRNVRLVELPKGDWAFTMMRQYLFDALELARAEPLVASGYRPLAEAAAKVRQEELYHYRHTHTWIRRLALGTAESRRRTQQALDELWPHTAQLFAPLAGEALLVTAGYLPDPEQLRRAWAELVTPFLEESELVVPEPAERETAGREEHTAHLAGLLAEMQEVAHLDAQAEW